MEQKYVERFWTKVQKSEGCWKWKDVPCKNGYGLFNVWPEKFYAHRVMWELTRGPIPAGLFVLHHCDNPMCVNPEHLFLGTNLDNVRDMMAKGRNPHGKTSYLYGHPEKNAQAKLSWDDVEKIKTLRAQGVMQKDLARQFSVSRSTIQGILYGKKWVTKVS